MQRQLTLDDKNFDFALIPSSISEPRNPLRKLLIIVLCDNVDIKVIKFASKVL